LVIKLVSTLLIVLINSKIFAYNSIVAIVNGTAVTSNVFKKSTSTINSPEKKIEIINKSIDIILQIEKANDLNVNVSEKDLNIALTEIAKNNEISMVELKKYPEFIILKDQIREKLSILNLQKFITKDLKISQDQLLNACTKDNFIKDLKQIRISQIIISEIDSQTNDLDKKNFLIKTFLKKLSSHIQKGASFEAFAKLHSQHSSYQNGGITNWLPVIGPTLTMLDSLDNREVSEIYMTDFGFAIAIKVDERFISSKLNKCKERVSYENAEMFYSDWLTNIRKDANIEIYYDKLL
jgi:parvulin-like peptidyl-prolyl isomerase